MRTHLPFAVIVLLTATDLLAQAVSPTFPMPTSGPDGACMRATDEAAWNAIRLTTEQLKQVQAAQTDFVKVGGPLDVIATDSVAIAIDDSLVSPYREQIRAVLTATQYERWIQWCIERTAPIRLKD